MKPTARMSSEDRRTAIIKTAQRVFVEKGFHRTTTRELAEAAGVSEALLFKHFPNKEALYSAIQMSCMDEQGSKIARQLESLEPSTSALVLLVRDLACHMLGKEPDEGVRSFIHLALRSLMDEGEFARLAIRGSPLQWVRKIEACIEAARAVGDMIEEPIRPNMGGWCAHQLITGILLQFLPTTPLIDYGVSREELVKQVTWFCLRGMGMKETAIQRYYRSLEISGD